MGSCNEAKVSAARLSSRAALLDEVEHSSREAALVRLEANVGFAAGDVFIRAGYTAVPIPELGGLLSHVDAHPHLIARSLYLGKDIPIGGTAHLAGTLRFGPDPATSVFDLNGKAHEPDNLYVVEADFFPSIGAINPELTIIANAPRVAHHLSERMT